MKGDPRHNAAESTGIMVEARRLGPGVRKGHDEFTFTVLEDAAEPARSGERRRAPRQRTRLRSGKIVDGGGLFLTECLWHDLSTRGGRLRVPPGIVLPAAIQVYDDQTGALYKAAVLWQRERNAGVALQPAATDERSRTIAADLRRKFYAVRN